jgi:hypothetical protein
VKVGFELFPFEGKRSPAVSILTLNLLKWITGSGLSAGFVPVGEVVPGVRDGLVLQQFDGLQGRNTIDGIGAVLHVPGLFRAESQIVAGNFFSVEESNLRESAPLLIPHVAGVERAKVAGSALYGWLALVVLGFLVLLAVTLTFWRVAEDSSAAQRGGAA